jgi:anti-sigma factor RsiW
MTHPSSSPTELPERDRELLSAYIDNELSLDERAALEQRLAVEPLLRRELVELRAVRDILREQSWVTPPRSFTLTPEMVGVRPRRFAFSRWWQPFGALGALVLVMLIGWQLLNLNRMPLQTAAPAAATAVPENVPALAAQPEALARQEPTSEPEISAMAEQASPAAGIAAIQSEPTDGAAREPTDGGHAGLPASPQPTRPSPPPLPVVVGLAILLVILAGIWFLRRRAE